MPLVMVTVLPLMEQAPLADSEGVVLIVPLLFVVTAKLDLSTAEAGAPVKLTVGRIFVAFAACGSAAAK